MEVKLNLLKGTNMVDFAIDIYKNLHPDEPTPEKLVEKRKQVVDELAGLESRSLQVISLLLKEDIQEQIASSRDSRQLFEYLAEEHNVSYISYVQLLTAYFTADSRSGGRTFQVCQISI